MCYSVTISFQHNCAITKEISLQVLKKVMPPPPPPPGQQPTGIYKTKP